MALSREAGLDQQAEDFIIQARMLKRQGNLGQLERQATLFMAKTLDGLEMDSARQAPAPVENLAYFAE